MGLRREFLDLLKTDEEFRYAVAGLIGLEDLRSGQAKLQHAVAELQNAVAELQHAVAELQHAVAELQKSTAMLAEALAAVRSEVGGLSATVGAMSESSARRALREWLKSRGLAADRLTPLRVSVDGEEVEVNFHGEARDERGAPVPVYAEVKAAVRSREVKDFARAAAKAEGIRGRGVRVLVGFRVYGDAYEAAAEEGVEIVEA